MKVRGTEFLYLRFEDGKILDLGRLLSGSVALRAGRQPVAVSLLTLREVPVDGATLDLLARIPADEWAPVERLAEEESGRQRILDLAAKGLVVSDADDGELAEIRSRDERLKSQAWNPYAALYHFMSRWEDVTVPGAGTSEAAEAITADALKKLVAEHGKPPSPFHELAEPRARTELPLVRRRGPLYDLLAARRTCRHFNGELGIELSQLATILYYVWGCHGQATFGPDELQALKKTSPSGGAMHPVEVYPLVNRVDGLASGLYHYNVRDHSLETIRKLPEEQSRELSETLTARQTFFGHAHVLFIMSARFYRNFWKYRQHKKAYAVIQTDLGHLSQTFYCVCADLGLGAFYTAAINNRDAEEALGLDGYEEGVLGISGCGRPLADGERRGPVFEPYVPRS